MTLAVDIVSVCATITGFLQLLGPAPDTRTILRTRSTGATPLVPLVSLLTVGWVWTAYGLLQNDIFPLSATNAMNVLLSTFYISVYYRFTPDRPYAHKVLAGFGLAIAAVTAYAVLGYYGHTGQSREGVANAMGYLGNVVVFVFYAAPFENLALVFRYRAGAFIPIMIVCSTMLNGAAWLTYSILVIDWFILVPNACALVIGSVQVAVYLYFHPSTHPLPDSVVVGAAVVAAHPNPNAVALVSPAGDESGVSFKALGANGKSPV